MAGVGSFLSVYLVLVGLMVGSFINLAMDRVPRGESLIAPPSHCRACARRLNAIDLLPVAGYLIRRGRCATCGTPIGLTAPVVEAASGACMVAGLAWLGPWPGGAIGLAAIALFGLGVVCLALLLLGDRHGEAGATEVPPPG
jgi:prepilin signal peptidase PulO-like enzyme (type II secretory pathway)